MRTYSGTKEGMGRNQTNRFSILAQGDRRTLLWYY